MAATAFQRSVDGWIAVHQAKGGHIEPAHLPVHGFPFAFATKLNNVTANWPSGYGFSAQTLKIRTRPWGLRRFKLSVTGGFSLSMPVGLRPADGGPPLARLAGETMRGKVGFSGSPVPSEVDLQADTVSLNLGMARADAAAPAPRETTAATVTIVGGRPVLAPQKDTDVAADLTLRLDDVSAQAIEGNPLGSTVRRADIHLQLLGITPALWDAAGLRSWRDSGGTLNLSEIGLEWGPLKLTGNGTAALDPQMQPEGAFSTTLSGFESTIDAFAAAGWIKPQAGDVAKLALGLAARPGPDGKPVVTTPITIQNRRISFGPVKLGTVPELHIE